MRKNAVIYSRVSSLNDRQNAERQIADLTQFADRNDFTILEIFSEKIVWLIELIHCYYQNYLD